MRSGSAWPTAAGASNTSMLWPGTHRTYWPLAAWRATQCFVVGRKVVRNSLESTLDKGLEQTAWYMDRCPAQAGHLVIFDRGKRRGQDKVFRRSELTNGLPIEAWGL